MRSSSTSPSLSEPMRASWQRVWPAAVLWALSLAAQYDWLRHYVGARPALLHLIPGSLTLAAVMALCAVALRQTATRLTVWVCYHVMTLRLGIALGASFAWMPWVAFVVLASVVLGAFVRSFGAEQSGRWLLLAFVLVAFNAFGHLAEESPFTHTFHLIQALPSDFHGTDNNATWECGYDGTAFAVQCDARHFIASELIFTNETYDARFSVVLVRFYAGFLNSLLGSPGSRWQASLALNVFLWMISCALVYRLARLFSLSPSIARAAMLTNASSLGFVSMVAQPAPYLPAYVFAIVSLWAAAGLAVDATPQPVRTFALVLLMVLAAGVYESYPISLACFLLLCAFKRFGAAFSLAAGQTALTLVWKHIGLAHVLGTLGDVVSASSGAANLSRDIDAWQKILAGLEWARLFHYVGLGTLAFVFGNLVLGALAGMGVTVWRWRWFKEGAPQRCFWSMALLVNVLTFAAMVFLIPQTLHWSPSTGMQPRLAFFAFAINTVALCYWANTIGATLLWAVPVLFFVIANVDKTGFASIPMLLDYGAIGWYWY